MMKTAIRGLVVTVAVTLACLCSSAVALAQDLTFEPVEKWSNVFSGSEVKFHYTARTPDGLDGQVRWSLSVNRRTIEHGQIPLTLVAGQAGQLTVALKVPEVKAGVVLQAQLAAAVYREGGQERVALNERNVWIFPRDPFADRSQWLKSLKITLFDPEGKTADVFEKAKIPFTFTKNTSALDDLSEGMLVIGEGTAWRDYRSLGESMVKAAARGVPVLCLAPGEGAMRLPGSESADLPVPKGLSLRQEDIISELDKRLDAVAWPPEGSIATSRLAVIADRDQVAIEITRKLRGWPWLEARYSPPRGRLIVCGFGIIRHWEATPTPRYLLSEILSRLDAEKSSTPSSLEERKER